MAQGNKGKGSELDALLQSTALHRGCTGVRARAGRPLLGGEDERSELAGTSPVVVDALPSAGTTLLADDDCRLERARDGRWWPGFTNLQARAGRPSLVDVEQHDETAGTTMVLIAALRAAGTSLLVDDDCRLERARARRCGDLHERSRGARSQ